MSQGQEMVFAPEGILDGAKAWEVRKALEALDKSTPVVVDFSKVTEVYDFGIAVLAHGIAGSDKKVKIMNLRAPQKKLFKYFGIKLDE